MKSARKSVVFVIEFTAGVQFCEYDFDAAHLGFRVDVGGHTSAVIFDRRGPVRVELYGYFIGVTVRRLVDGVVDYFPKNVMQAPYTRRTDIHTGAHTDGFKTFQNL